VDPDLLNLVQQHVNSLKADVGQLTFEVQEDKKPVIQALKDISTSLEGLEARVASVQHEQEVMKQEQSLLLNKLEDQQRRDVRYEDKLSSSTLRENRGKCVYKDASIYLVTIIIIIITLILFLLLLLLFLF